MSRYLTSTNARYLWKRIPTAVKSNAAEPSAVELQHIWSVFQALWLNDTPAFFTAVQWRWTLATVAELMGELEQRVRRQTIELIALAYSSIFEDHLQQLVQQEPAAVEEVCRTLGWSIEEGPTPRLVRPKRRATDELAGVDAEQQLAKLTDFVSFLEN